MLRDEPGKESPHCVTCGSGKVAHEDFKDLLSRKEYHLSGMCQSCQDLTFSQTEDD